MSEVTIVTYGSWTVPAYNFTLTVMKEYQLCHILKAPWSDGNGSTGTGKSGTSNHLCFQCHDWNTYGDANGSGSNTGFSESNYGNNLHNYHMGKSDVRSCQSCHSAVPHGYGGGRSGKSRAMLVEYDEAQPYDNGSSTYGSQLGIASWATSGNWNKNNCSIGSRSGGHG